MIASPAAGSGDRRMGHGRDPRLVDAPLRELDAAVAAHGPVCELSGRCCRFREYGHTLFLSAPEAALLLAEPPPRLARSTTATCPWQDLDGRCTAREARPLGCRVYFCDPAFEAHAPELTEQFLGQLKQEAARHDWPWDYAPLHKHLFEAHAEGRLATPMADSEDADGGDRLA